MARCLLPNWEDLQARCANGREVLVSAPFYSAEALEWITPHPEGKLELWTRLNPHDWAARFNDPEALLDYIDRLGRDRVSLLAHRALHAKFYVVDRSWGWVGSANLTLHAFQQNVEIVCELSSEQEVQSLLAQVDTLRPVMAPISVERLKELYDCVADVVKEIQERGETGIPEELHQNMEAAVKLCDEVLTPPPGQLPTHRVPDIRHFIDYLHKHDQFPSARVILERYYNTRGANLQGHVRQSYFGACLFLMYPDYRKYRAALMDEALAQRMPRISPEIIRSWQVFLDKYAQVSYERNNEHYSLSTLRNILPESLGGYTTSGGGASPTWRRVIAWVARFLEAEGL